jgi:hypothetical protein
LHLTRVDAFCTMTPNFQHVDAICDREKSAARAQRDVENPSLETEARAVNATFKSADDEEIDMNEIQAQLKAMDEEPWQYLEWVDDGVCV